LRKEHRSSLLTGLKRIATATIFHHACWPNKQLKNNGAQITSFASAGARDIQIASADKLFCNHIKAKEIGRIRVNSMN
jgi:hypothetical protein